MAKPRKKSVTIRFSRVEFQVPCQKRSHFPVFLLVCFETMAFFQIGSQPTRFQNGETARPLFESGARERLRAPQNIQTSGVIQKQSPPQMNATWNGQNGPKMQFGVCHKRTRFRKAVEMTGKGEMTSVFRADGEKPFQFGVTKVCAPEINVFLDKIARNQAPAGITPHRSPKAVKIAGLEFQLRFFQA